MADNSTPNATHTTSSARAVAGGAIRGQLGPPQIQSLSNLRPQVAITSFTCMIGSIFV